MSKRRSGRSPGMNVQVAVQLKEMASLDRFLLSKGIDVGRTNSGPVRWCLDKVLETLSRQGMEEFESGEDAFEWLKKRGYSLAQLDIPYWRKAVAQEIQLDDIKLEAPAGKLRTDCVYEVNTVERYSIQDLIKSKGPGVISELREIQLTPEFKAQSLEEQELAVTQWIQQRMEE